jgi:hypothetical protein
MKESDHLRLSSLTWWNFCMYNAFFAIPLWVLYGLVLSLSVCKSFSSSQPIFVSYRD